jgi:hypothetical protein
MLTGRSAPASPGLVFYDSWEMAGDGSPGYTWSNRNPLAAIGLYPHPALRLHPRRLASAPWCRTSDPLFAARCPHA